MVWVKIIILITFILLSSYALLIHVYRVWFRRLKPFKNSNDVAPSTRFSIIIPARDEENSISTCVQSILQNNYPNHLYEIIVIDDHSTDETANIVQQLQQQYENIRLIKLADILKGQQLNSYKKKAIEMAINQSFGEWIVTTDADCIVTTEWLSEYDAYIRQYNPVFVAAPVMFINTGAWVSIFQCLDFISLQGITAASVSSGFHSMCNGANLAYRKDIFYEVGAFKGIDTIASGDDMLLMHKIQMAYPTRIGYLFSQKAVVQTLPMPNWKGFINQRIRWASKADSYNDRRIYWVLLYVYVLNLLLFLLPFTTPWYHPAFYYWLGLLLLKTFSEFTFMYFAASFFNLQQLLRWFPLMQPFHIVYTVIAGWLGKFGKYNWKGRTVK